MKIFLCVILFLLLAMTGRVCLAQETELSTLYGQDYLMAPASARLKFQNETGISWVDASLSARRKYMLKWEESLVTAVQSKAAENKRREVLEKSILKANTERVKQAKDLAQDQAAKDKAKAKEKKDNDKKIADMRKKRIKELRDLRRKQQTRNRKQH